LSLPPFPQPEAVAITAELPPPQHDLHFMAPITRWDEAIPLGNGLLGALVWGNGSPLRLSLDRADLWDLRPVPDWEKPDYNFAAMEQWIAAGRLADLHDLYERPYRKYPGPTKIPAGRLEIDLPSEHQVTGSRLRLAEAVAAVSCANGVTLEILVHAERPIGYIYIQGLKELPNLKLKPPPFAADAEEAGETVVNVPDNQKERALTNLGYPAPQLRQGAELAGFTQEGWGGFTYALALAWKQQYPDTWEIAWSIATAHYSDTEEAWQKACSEVNQALACGWLKVKESHEAWWRRFWNSSGLRLPHQVLERQWYLDTYKFGATARRGAPPISLQAVWTADDGLIPPWKGDYHHDLNTQLSYWPCYSGNHLTEGLSYLDWLWATRSEAERWTRHFWQKPGLNVPMTSDLLGRQMGGWHPYTHSATTSAWLAHHFYLHWRYSRDRNFLAERAYPYLSEVCCFLAAVTQVGKDGRRYLPLSSSPEIHDNTLKAWLKPNSNYDLALMRWAFTAAAELAGELGLQSDVDKWLAILAELPDFSYGPQGQLLLAPDEPLSRSHRHFSHLLAIHPLGLITWEDGDQAQRTILASLSELQKLGSEWWCGYSFAWLGNLAARAKQGELAAQALEIFAKAFCSINSFHLNGDQTRSGYSKYTYRPFTLEGNFAAAAAIQEMLLQSYGGVIRLFPAIPKDWRTCAFTSLRAEGGFLVSARLEEGRVTFLQIEATADAELRLVDPFGVEPCGDTEVSFHAYQADPGGMKIERSAGTGLFRAMAPAGAVYTWRKNNKY